MEQNDRKPKTVVLLIVIVGVLIALGFIGYRFFMVESVTIKGNSYYTSSEIAELAAIPRNTHIFTLDEAKIKKNIEADPRVVVDSIDYVFPNGIEITVRERFPAAFVEFGGEDYILSNDLIVLDDEESDESVIPALKGMGVQSASLGDVLEADDSYKVSVASGILTASLHNDVLREYREIDLSDTNTVMLETRGGLKINFGQGDNYEEKTEWISKMIDSLAKEGVNKGTIDVSSGKFATFRP